MKLFVALFAVLLQLAPSPPFAATPGQGGIQGVVTRAGDGLPIAGAELTLAAANAEERTAGGSLTAISDAEGRFAFRDLSAGAYTITTVSNGYVRQIYGERYPGSPGKVLVLADGQAVRNVVVGLVAAGNVDGHLRSATGRAAPGVSVRLMRQAFDETGRRQFVAAAAARTDDRGYYRFYWVTPGRYYIIAGVPTLGLDSNESNANEVVDNAPYTFFPGTTEVEKALAIDVRPAAELDGMDFSLSQAGIYRIRARIIDPTTGQPPRQAIASISYSTPGSTGGMGGGNLYNNETGIMEFPRVLPGIYTVGVTAYEGPGIPTRAMSRTSGGWSTGADVVVSNADVDLGVLQMAPPNVITGRFEGDPLPASMPESSLAVLLLHDMARTDPNPATVRPRPGENFTAYSPHPWLRIVVRGLPEAFYVKEARLDGQDVLSQPARVAGASSLQIVLSANAGQVEGTVRDATSQPAASARVALVPDDVRHRFELFKQTLSDESGRFIISGIAPGNYTIYAWETLDANGFFDPVVLGRAAGSGIALRIGESAQEKVELKIIPAGQE